MSVKEGVIKSAAHRNRWRDQFGGFCWACGGSYLIQVHHICKRPKSDEWCNLSSLCLWCHMRAEGAVVVVAEGRKGPISLAQVLGMKRQWDPSNFDPARLEELKGEAMPRPVS